MVVDNINSYSGRGRPEVTVRARYMERVTCLLASTIAGGASLVEALAELRARGATPIEVIKAIHCALGVSLGEAKHIFSDSPAWAQETAAGKRLYEEVTAALSAGVKR